DHPSFGMAIIGRVLEAQGFRVGMIAQPDWHSADAFAALGAPNLFFGITAGNMDSMVKRYTADRRVRSDDAYTPGGAAGERQICELAHRLAGGESIRDITDLRGTVFARRGIPADWIEIDSTHLDAPGPLNAPLDPYAMEATGAAAPDAPTAPCVGAPAAPGGEKIVRFVRRVKNADRERSVIRMPGWEAVAADPVLYAHASRILHLESNPGNARALAQRHGDLDVWLNPPPIPLTTAEMDWVYERPYGRTPHPSYGKANIPAYKMIRFSVAIQRGCFGGCTFCSITEHEGRIIQSRSEDSVLREIGEVR